MIDGVAVPFTPEEETARDAEEAQYLAEKPMNDWLDQMNASDSSMLPRTLEDLITGNPSLTLNTDLKAKYDAKVALRASKPS